MLSNPPSIDIPAEEFEFTYARSGGPGGQNVNKVNSKVLLRWAVTTSPSLPEGVRATIWRDSHRAETADETIAVKRNIFFMNGYL